MQSNRAETLEQLAQLCRSGRDGLPRAAHRAYRHAGAGRRIARRRLAIRNDRRIDARADGHRRAAFVDACAGEHHAHRTPRRADRSTFIPYAPALLAARRPARTTLDHPGAAAGRHSVDVRTNVALQIVRRRSRMAGVGAGQRHSQSTARRRSGTQHRVYVSPACRCARSFSCGAASALAVESRRPTCHRHHQMPRRSAGVDPVCRAHCVSMQPCSGCALPCPNCLWKLCVADVTQEAVVVTTAKAVRDGFICCNSLAESIGLSSLDELHGRARDSSAGQAGRT